MTIPTYRDLEDRIKVLESKLEYWSGLNSFDEVKSKEWYGDWDEERISIIGQNGNDGLHYDKEGM
jgi:hypothetical protein